MLRFGDKGDKVARMQRLLNEKGFPCGEDETGYLFGEGTLNALKGFQASQKLIVDGVYGPQTQKKLAGAAEEDAPDVTGSVTVDLVCSMFPYTPRANIEKHLPVALNALRFYRLTDKNMVMMALATIRAESEGFVPISEGKSRFNTSPGGRPFDLYDNRRDLGNRGFPDGERYRGRGFIQLTGRANYKSIGHTLNCDLEGNPEIANDPAIAAAVLAVFLQKKRFRIKDALAHNDLYHARRLVNGGSHGIERFIDAYKRGLKELPDVA